MKLKRTPMKVVLRDAKNFLIGGFFCTLTLLVLNKLLRTICWLRLLFGFPCPLCGMTRATILFIKGDFCGAWQMHAMFYLVVLFVPFYIFFKYFVKNGCRFIKIYVIIFIILTIGYYIYRMSELFPGQEPLLYDSDNWFNYIRKLLEVKGN